MPAYETTRARACSPTARPVARGHRRRWPALLGVAAVAVGLLASPVLARDVTLEQAAQAPSRSPALLARDAARHPVEELRFLGVTPRSSVVEIWPGGGYWTDTLGWVG